MSQVSRRNLLLLAMPALFIVLWSGGYAVAKVGLKHADPLTFLSLRYAGAFALLLVAMAVLRPALPVSGKQWGQLALIGLLIQVGYFVSNYIAFSHGVSAGAVALISSLQPILVGLLAPSLIGESVGGRRWLGLVFGLAGAGLVIYARSHIEVTSAVGFAYAVAALVSMSAAAMLEKHFMLKVHPVTANLVQYATGLAVVLPLALLLEPMHVDWSPEFWAALAYLVVGNSIIAITLLLAMIRAGEASRVSALLFLVPPIAALIAAVLLGEAMPPLAWAGMAVAAVGVALATIRSPVAAGAPK